MRDDITRGHKNISRFLESATLVQMTRTQERDALRFIARVLVQAAFPHSEVNGVEWRRQNGALTVHMLAPSDTGLPYGSYPRLLMTWITTEAVRNKKRCTGDDQRRLELGHSLSEFMAQLGLIPTGGKYGTIGRLRDQMERLFSTAIVARELTNDENTGQRRTRIGSRVVADDAELWWDPKSPDQGVLWGSYVTLSRPFFDMITERPVPVDMDVLRLLKKSPLALDVYSWATYRVSYLSRPTLIPWHSLMLQMGAGYPDTTRGRLDFKKKFVGALAKVHAAWPALKAEPQKGGLRLRPSPPQVQGKG